MSERQDLFTRFSLEERIQHALLLVTVTILALTGLPQKFPTSDWSPLIIHFFGGIHVARIIHRVCALILTMGVVYHVLFGIIRLVTKRARFEMLPRRKDFNDIGGNIAYFLGIKKERPRFDRFNYIEKFEYWAVLWGMGVMSLTGLILWFPAIAARVMPGLAIPAAKAAHSGEAFLAVTAVVIWHMYNAHLSPRVFPINMSIFTGKVSKHEMMAEHAQEYEQRMGETVPDEILAEAPSVSWYTLLTSGLVGIILVAIFSGLLYWSIAPPKPVLTPPFNPPLERDFVVPHELMQGTEAFQIWSGSHRQPTADFSMIQHVGGSNLLNEFLFQDKSTGEVTSRLWNFGDGVTSLEQDPAHVYTTKCPGISDQCTVTLTVCGPGGCATASKRAAIDSGY